MMELLRYNAVISPKIMFICVRRTTFSKGRSEINFYRNH